MAKLLVGTFTRENGTTFNASVKMGDPPNLEADLLRLTTANKDGLIASHKVVDSYTGKAEDDPTAKDAVNTIRPASDEHTHVQTTYEAEGFETYGDYKDAQTIGVTAEEFYGSRDQAQKNDAAADAEHTADIAPAQVEGATQEQAAEVAAGVGEQVSVEPVEGTVLETAEGGDANNDGTVSLDEIDSGKKGKKK